MKKLAILNNNPVNRLVWLSLAGQAGFSGLVLLLHFLRPDYDPVSRFISEYAVGRYSLLMVIAFEGLGLGSLALAAALRLDQLSSPAKYFRNGIRALTLWGGAVLVVGLFPTTLKEEPFTATSIIHGFASIFAFLCLLGAAFYLAKEFKTNARWNRLYQPARWLAWLMLISLIGFFASPSDFKGLTERWLVAVFIAWLSFISWSLALTACFKTQKVEPGEKQATSLPPAF